MWMYGNSWWMWLLMVAGTVGFWVLVVVTVKALLDDRRPDAPAAAAQPTADPGSVLDARLARGDIDAEEYLRLRRLLQQGHSADQDRPVAR